MKTNLFKLSLKVLMAFFLVGAFVLPASQSVEASSSSKASACPSLKELKKTEQEILKASKDAAKLAKDAASKKSNFKLITNLKNKIVTKMKVFNASIYKKGNCAIFGKKPIKEADVIKW